MKSCDIMQERQSVSTALQTFTTNIAVFTRNNALWSIDNNKIYYKTEFLRRNFEMRKKYTDISVLSPKAKYL